MGREEGEAVLLMTAMPVTLQSLLGPKTLVDLESSTLCGYSLIPLCQPGRFRQFGMWAEFTFLILCERN